MTYGWPGYAWIQICIFLQAFVWPILGPPEILSLLSLNLYEGLFAREVPRRVGIVLSMQSKEMHLFKDCKNPVAG